MRDCVQAVKRHQHVLDKQIANRTIGTLLRSQFTVENQEKDWYIAFWSQEYTVYIIISNKLDEIIKHKPILARIGGVELCNQQPHKRP